MIKRSVALSAVVVVLASAAHAESSEAASSAIGTCSGLTDAQARLACYDQLAAKLKAGEAVAPQAYAPAAPMPVPVAQAPAAPAQTAAQSFGQATPDSTKEKSSWYNPGSWFGGGNDTPHVTTGTPAEFGAEALPPAKPAPGMPATEPLDHITATVTSVTFNGTGRFRVALDNGQMWKQIEGDTGVARFSRTGHDSVTISRGALGSYNLVIGSHNATFKVTRIQ